jgi:hypothetical protein
VCVASLIYVLFKQSLDKDSTAWKYAFKQAIDFLSSMNASADSHRTASAKRTAAVGAAVVVLTPALGVAVALAALPLFLVAVLLVAASLGGGGLLALLGQS